MEGAVKEGCFYTVEEYYKLTEHVEEHMELIAGKIVALAAPSELHQTITLRTAATVDAFIRSQKGNCKTMIAPFDVVIDDHNVVQPDVLVVCDPSKMDGKRCNGAPDWVIEITSSNRETDFREKLLLYRDSGVREYWIVDTQEKRVFVYCFEQHPNVVAFYDWSDSIPVNIYQGKFTVCIADLI